MVSKTKYFLGFLTVVLLTSSIYYMLPDEVKCDIKKTNTEYSVWENESWVLSATEYVNLYDGTKKMRAKERKLINWNDSEFAYTQRVSTWKDNIVTIQTYTFSLIDDEITQFPLKNEFECLNCEGKIVHYEIRDILYDGLTKQINSPFSFGHNMKIEFQDGHYYSKVFQQKSSDKIIIKYRPTSIYETYNVRLFDPPAPVGVNSTKLETGNFGGKLITQTETDKNYPCYLQESGEIVCPAIKGQAISELAKSGDLTKGVPLVDLRKPQYNKSGTEKWTDENGKVWDIEKFNFTGYKTEYLNYNQEQKFNLNIKLDGKVRVGFNSNVWEITDFVFGSCDNCTAKSYGVVLENTHADYDADMVGWWKFTDDAIDSSGNGNDGFINGACLIGETMIKTTDGLKRVDEIKKGDIAYSYTKEGLIKQEVSDLIPNGIKEVFEVRTRNRKITATDNHPFLVAVYQGQEKDKIKYHNINIWKNKWELEWKELGEINEGDLILVQSKDTLGNQNTHTLDFMKFVGVFLGDGSFHTLKNGYHQITLSLYDEELMEKYTKILEKEGLKVYRNGGDLRITNSDFGKRLIELDLNKNVYTKRVPAWVWELSNEHKKALLEGVIDSDGYKLKNVKDTYGVELVNEDLIEDFRQLAIDVGYRVTNIVERQPRDGGIIDGRQIKSDKKHYSFSFKTIHTNYPTLRAGIKERKRVSIDLPKGFELQKVLNINSKGKQETYDLVMPVHHNFIANGIIVHNTHNFSWYDFDGDGGCIEIADDNSLDFGTGNFSVSLWFYPKKETTTQRLFSKVIAYRNKQFEIQFGEATKEIKVRFGDDGANTDLTYNVPSINQWINIILVRENGTGYLYVDGVLKDLDTVNYNITNTVVLKIGERSYNPGSSFNGSIDEVIIYNRSLSSSEISDLYNKGLFKHQGNYTSGILDAGQNVNWTNINWTYSNKTANQNVSMQVRTGEIAKLDFADSSLVSMWSLNQTDRDGNTAIDTMGRNNGTANGSMSLGQVGGVFQGENATLFDGVDDYISISTLNSTSEIGNNFTFSLWFNSKISDGNYRNTLVGDSWLSQGSYVIYHKDGTLTASVKDETNTERKCTATIENNVWTNMVFLFNGTHTILYLNGIEKDNYNIGVGNFVMNEAGMIISEGSNDFSGSIAYVSIFNKSLTQDEIMNWSTYTGELLISQGETLDLPVNRFLQYKVKLQTNTSETPILTNVVATYGDPEISVNFGVNISSMTFNPTHLNDQDVWAVNQTNAIGLFNITNIGGSTADTIGIKLNDTKTGWRMECNDQVSGNWITLNTTYQTIYTNLVIDGEFETWCRIDLNYPTENWNAQVLFNITS